MQNQKVQEYTVRPNASGLPVAELGHVHDLRTFVRSGSAKIHWLDDRFVSDNGDTIPSEDVPQEIKDAVASMPFKSGKPGEVTHVYQDCEYCMWSGVRQEYADHLVKAHVSHDKKAAFKRIKPEDIDDAEKYVLDEDGFVALKADGTPKLKAGRPPKA
jgi:hypothetical protein